MTEVRDQNTEGRRQVTNSLLRESKTLKRFPLSSVI